MNRRSGKSKAGQRRVAFRRNRSAPARRKQWNLPDHADDPAHDAAGVEAVRAKGELSRMRTVVDRPEGAEAGRGPACRGVAVAVRGQFVEVDDGQRIWLCTVRRVLRTRLIGERHPVVTGDEVTFSALAHPAEGAPEGVIEQVHERRTALHRSDGRRTQVIAANIDQVVITTSIRRPMIKVHLIDRYLVAAHAGRLTPIICINKADLGPREEIAEVRELYRGLGYAVLVTSTVTGEGIDELGAVLAGKVSMFAGQSGVGKSSLLNAVEPGLNLRTADVSTDNEKGRHTTTTAVRLRLSGGGTVVDTPGIRALDVAMVPIQELEAHFVEFVDRVRDCRFPNCVHLHETGCAIKSAVEAGGIARSRYESYTQLLLERSEPP